MTKTTRNRGAAAAAAAALALIIGLAAPGIGAAGQASAAKGRLLPSEVVPHPRPADALPDRVAWARAEAKRAAVRDGYWTAWTIRRLMGENSRMGSFSSDWRDEPSLLEVVTGRRPADLGVGSTEAVRRTAQKILEDMEASDKPEAKVWKDLAILLRYPSPSAASPDRIRMSNMDLVFDFEGRPLYWLGGAPDGESAGLIEKIYEAADAEKVRKQAVAAIGIHDTKAAALPFLKRVLGSDAAVAIRKDAAFWLGQQDDPSALELLIRTARSDAAPEVRKAAVFAVSQTDLPEAVDALIDMAESATDGQTRKEAIFWLGQKASAKAGESLVRFAYDDNDAQVRERAVFALSQLPDNQGVEPLIRIAKTHPDPGMRKKAVFWLGETKDPRALAVLIEIVKGK